MFTRQMTKRSINTSTDPVIRLKETLENSDAVVIGAGAGLSTAAGFTYSGERFKKYFSDFEAEYGFHDMYSGGFYPYNTLEEHWAYWSRYIYINRFMDPPLSVYSDLFELVKDKDYFVLTTNVDHCFQKAGFDKKRLFYTQGDYGLLQCSVPCHKENYGNEEFIKEMLTYQGFSFSESGDLLIPENAGLKTRIPKEFIPHCPRCGKYMTMNLRSDNTFVEDEGWHRAAENYSLFLRRHKDMKILFLELGVGYNTPVIIKFPFWQMTAKNPAAVYACINFGDAGAPKEIISQSICINEDIAGVLKKIRNNI